METSNPKPLAFFDLETTGLDKEKDRIVEICILKLMAPEDPDPLIYYALINPGIEIPKQVTDIHGITNQDVEKEPHFSDVATDIFEFINGCDIAGFNSNYFDVPILYYHLNRAGIDWDYRQVNFIDIGNIYKIREPRTLAAAYKHYVGVDLPNAHSAKDDIKATLDVFRSQIELYADLPTERAALALYSNFNKPILDISGKFTTDAEGDVIFNFGKHIGKKAADERGYIEWMLGGNFPDDTKKIARDIYFRQIK